MIIICYFVSGKRFAVYQSKLGLITLIQKFKFEVCEKTCKKYIIDPSAVVLAPKTGLYLKISKV